MFFCWGVLVFSTESEITGSIPQRITLISLSSAFQLWRRYHFGLFLRAFRSFMNFEYNYHHGCSGLLALAVNPDTLMHERMLFRNAKSISIHEDPIAHVQPEMQRCKESKTTPGYRNNVRTLNSVFSQVDYDHFPPYCTCIQRNRFSSAATAH